MIEIYKFNIKSIEMQTLMNNKVNNNKRIFICLKKISALIHEYKRGNIFASILLALVINKLILIKDAINLEITETTQITETIEQIYFMIGNKINYLLYENICLIDKLNINKSSTIYMKLLKDLLGNISNIPANIHEDLYINKVLTIENKEVLKGLIENDMLPKIPDHIMLKYRSIIC